MKKIILLTLALVLAACTAGASSEYDQNLQKWQNADIEHYRYSLFISCFCPFTQDMPLTIEVQNGEVVSMTKADGTIVESSDPSHQYYVPYATIDGIFAELKSDLSEADEVLVTYDGTYGYPATIAIDQIKEAIDDELSLEISNFEVLP
jgi:hypothetical protein